MNRIQFPQHKVSIFILFLLSGLLLSFSAYAKKEPQSGDLHLVATPEALQRMELSPLFQQAASVPRYKESFQAERIHPNIMHLSTVEMDDQQVIHIMDSGSMRRFRLGAMTFDELEASARFRPREIKRGRSLVGFFISIDSGALAIMLHREKYRSGEIESGLRIQSLITHDDSLNSEPNTLKFSPLELVKDEWIELGIRTDRNAVIATIAGQEFRTPVAGLTENTAVDVGLAIWARGGFHSHQPRV